MKAIKGSTVILNEDYINVLTSYKDMIKQKLDDEIVPNEIKKLEKQYEVYSKKLEEALDFSDIIEEVIDIDMPRLTTVRTVKGLVLPLSNIQIL